ncbi:NADP-dependent methylenetetrahydromethanopterin/methylenetetrahydrofolate dehydrogenase [Methylocystis bryophila]|uniref:Methylenetetrahydrofolate dehydrogenase n=1 Tax=Methylocystis bryophila TaxID=655015 RepID=A0A1W6MYB4_9HYPH|nr:NADP-dependent methylenetetrahydromethanopterin/methylenetetrahydrofolate dehydrogenase [Methylocystis bryophila]ARN82587.1 methylenetetrahydrofolate dehydrogenase [Methylocystis bryophila]BDV38799.1 MtdA bifunctional protein [Methylocystis bryophila]
MTKKLLFLLDTDPVPSVFDTVVGYDGGADHVIGYGGVTPENVGALVDGAIYTRGPKEKQFTALFVGGGSMVKGEELFKVVKKRFFSSFRVSTMLDSNGSNTTAAAGVALLAKAKPLAGLKAVVLAGTGPVGMRAAAMLHIEGAEVALTSRQLSRAKASSEAIKERFGFAPTPIEAFDNAARAAAVKGAQIVFAAGAIGVPLLDEKDWQNDPTIELLADCNAQPPLGLGGVEATDKAKERHGKIVIGALGLGGLKLKLHRECVGKMFEASDKVFDAENIYALAKELA